MSLLSSLVVQGKSLTRIGFCLVKIYYLSAFAMWQGLPGRYTKALVWKKWKTKISVRM